ncbi:IclR family transcriptional regulator [Sphingorhabdus sp.]|uniref:IclR family transcriptional regulator n=1 Tax=Sphingorhabdus sp. TaxID=1902408 RepID=UPI002FD9493E
MVRKDDRDNEHKDGPTYQAPALEKGLDIIELLAQSGEPLSRSDIAKSLGRSVGEIYRMLHQLVQRKYIALAGDSYVLTTKLFELSHHYPPTQRLLTEATPVMHKLAGDIDQSCHLTVYSQGRQLVIAKVDVPSGMGFSVRVGSELDVLVSASGRVLLSFQDSETRKLRISESHLCETGQDLEALHSTLEDIAKRGFEAAPSGQVRGLFAISYPILDLRGHAIAALTVPYADRIDLSGRKSQKDVEVILADAARLLTARLSGV